MTTYRITAIGLMVALLSGCLVAKAVDTAVDVTVGVTKGVVKTGAKAVDLAIPDGDDEQQPEDSDD